MTAVRERPTSLAARLKRLVRVVRGVRGVDTDARDLPPESRGLEPIAEGFGAVGTDDHDILRLDFPVYDARLAYCTAAGAATR